MKIVPVNFNKEHKMILELDGGRIAINPNRFDKLITAPAIYAIKRIRV